MTDPRKWIATRVRLGWALLAAGSLASYFARWATSATPYNFRIIIALGSLLMASGLYFIVRFRAGLKDEASARRIMANVRDERTVMIRMRAGNRAFWMSSVLVYAGLMWTSYAAKGELPVLSQDALWNFLAAAVVVPFAVYIGSILIEERTS